jgi:hypothetical protein
MNEPEHLTWYKVGLRTGWSVSGGVSEVKWSEVKWSEVKWSEVRSVFFLIGLVVKRTQTLNWQMRNEV